MKKLLDLTLGIELDSVEMTARLPDDKSVKYQGIVQVMLEAEFLSLKELQSAIGNLCMQHVLLHQGDLFFAGCIAWYVTIQTQELKY